MKTRPPQCDRSDYGPFEPDHLTIPTQHVDVVPLIEMHIIAAMSSASDATMVDREIREAQRLYRETAALRAAVLIARDARIDDAHLGERLDQIIVDELERARTASSALTLERVGTHVTGYLRHFMFAAFSTELRRGTAEGWDRAFAYFGASTGGAFQRGLAAVAFEREAGNLTQHTEKMFDHLVSGSCDLAIALEEDNTSSIDPFAHAKMAEHVRELDDLMELALIYSFGIRLLDVLKFRAKPWSDPTVCCLTIMQVEGAAASFAIIEPLLAARGDPQRIMAQRWRTALEAGVRDMASASSFDAQSMLSELESEYGVDIYD